MKKNIKIILVLTLVILNIGCDQVSKSMAREQITQGERTELLGGHFILLKTENTGAFLSMGQDWHPTLKKVVFWGLPIVVLLGLLGLLLFTNRFNRNMIIGLSFIIGGGLGNLYDRILYGSVTDFMLIDIGIAKTGIFNVADMSIMIGMGIILLDTLLGKEEKKQLN